MIYIFCLVLCSFFLFKSSFRNVVFSRYLEFQTMDEVHKHSGSESIGPVSHYVLFCEDHDSLFHDRHFYNFLLRCQHLNNNNVMIFMQKLKQSTF
jgi:hypothetical protein